MVVQERYKKKKKLKDTVYMFYYRRHQVCAIFSPSTFSEVNYFLAAAISIRMDIIISPCVILSIESSYLVCCYASCLDVELSYLCIYIDSYLLLCCLSGVRTAD